MLDVSEDYDLAVIGEPSGAFGWILARTPMILTRTAKPPLSVLREYGYDTSDLIWTEQTG